MCGIAGLFDADKHGPDSLRARIQPMSDSLSLRGPDDQGIWLGEGVALGHRRLSILELSPAGAQPMVSACTRFTIAFNGEIYNHLDLRRELESVDAAPTWRGHSDTETLLAAVAHWGLEQTLQRTKGMFAIALWDRKERRLSLARDRMGEKPLYWGWAGATLVFASELKALRKHPGFPGKICREATAQYLRFGYVPAPRSIHPGIYKLEPGCILEVSDTPPVTAPDEPLRAGDRYETLSIHRYWSLNDIAADGASNQFTNEHETLTSLDAALSDAVSRQMAADVPLGAFLSGGIDSSLVVAIMQQQSGRAVQTFTVGFDNAAYDESSHAEVVARHLGTDHTMLRVTEAETRDLIPNLPDLYDEPFADSSQIPTHLICRAARRKVTVALSGDAADELFGGYTRYLWGPQLWKRLRYIPSPLRQVLGRSVMSIPVESFDRLGKLQQRLRPGATGISRLGDKTHKLAEACRSVNNVDELYRGLVTVWDKPEAILGVLAEPKSVLDDPLPKALDRDPAGRMMAQDMRSYLPDDILCKVDRAAMGVSLETRVPFLDPDVVTLAARLPMQMKIRDGSGKWALRQLLYRRVPRELMERPKTGFAIPVGEWLRGPLREWAEDLLSADKLSADGLLDPAPIRQVWAEHLSGRRDWTHRLWTVLMLQAWRERWPLIR